MGITSVVPNSPAALAGLQPGQIVLSVNGQPLVSEQAMAQAIQLSLGTLVMEVIHQGCSQPYHVTVYLQPIYSHSY